MVACNIHGQWRVQGGGSGGDAPPEHFRGGVDGVTNPITKHFYYRAGLERK